MQYGTININPCKCLATDRHGDQCRNKLPKGVDALTAVGGARFCQRSHQYMADYTMEMLSQTAMCKGCSRHFFFGPGGEKASDETTGETLRTCAKCRSRGCENRKAVRASVRLCAFEGGCCGEGRCQFKIQEGSKYCGTHRRMQEWLDEVRLDGNKVCLQHVRGCRSVLPPDYPFKKCDSCRAEERASETRERVEAREKRARMEDEESGAGAGAGAFGVDVLVCTRCATEYPRDHFIKSPSATGEGLALTCKKCREWGLDQDFKRGYRLFCETVSKKVDPVVSILSETEWKELVVRPCLLCGDLKERGYHSLYRIDDRDEFRAENLFACCKKCSPLAKPPVVGERSLEECLHVVEHLATRLCGANGQLHGELFYKTSTSFKNLKEGAKYRNLLVAISEREYDAISRLDCYLCGKSSTDTYHNGIDRFDNDLGYTMENVRSCCTTCNMIKKDAKYEDFVAHIKKVYDRMFDAKKC
jgi:hypothetical protein